MRPFSFLIFCLLLSSFFFGTSALTQEKSNSAETVQSAAQNAAENSLEDAITIAVKEFQTRPKTADSFYGRDVATSINTELQKVPKVRIFDRNANWTFMQEMKLSMQGLTSEDRSANKGKLISPDYFIEGEVVISGTELLIRVRVYETESRFIVAGETVQGPSESFFDLEEKLSEKLHTLFSQLDFKKKKIGKESMQRSAYDFYNQSLQTKSIEDKIALLNESLKKNPDFLQALHLLASAYEESKSTQKCIEIYQRIIELDPSDYTAYWNLGVHSFTIGNISEPKDYFKKCTELQPDDVDAWYNLGVISEFNEQKQRFGSGVKLQDPLAYYKKAVKINSSHENALYAAGLLSGQLSTRDCSVEQQKQYIQDAIHYLEGFVEHSGNQAKIREVKEQLEIFRNYLTSMEG